ncbi:MAG: hypothetical protein LM577_01965 [Thermoproteaceae archaeon]|nr:hypothetical protein [Thermoproteaceae archaeon]
MRGQLILLTALVVAVAVAAVIAAQMALNMGQFSSSVRTGYGIYAKAWPEAVDLADSHALQAALKAASQISAGALSSGLYASPAKASRWLTYNATYLYLNRSLAVVKENFLPLGAQLDFSVRVRYYGFNGTLGPYPLAAPLGRWNIEPLRNGYMSIQGADLYRIVAVWQAPDYDGYYAVTYGAHVSEPGAVGEIYHVALGELLRKLRNANPERSLFVFLVDSQTCRMWQLPWWAEMAKCPLCLLHVRIPSRSEIGASEPVLQGGKALELLAVLTPNYVGDSLPVIKSGPCAGGSVETEQVPLNFDINNNPKAVFAQTVEYSGPRPSQYSGWLFWDASDIVQWAQSTVSTTSSCYPDHPVTGGVLSAGKSVVYDAGFGRVAEVYATYDGGTKNWAFNLYTGPVALPSNWAGFMVEALVRPAATNTVRPARLDLYFYSSDPASTHPICANFLGVQAVWPVLVWSSWRGHPNGVWNGRTWDDSGTVYFQTSWYLFSLAASTSVVRYQVFSYNTTRPLRVLGTKTLQGNPWGTTWQFYVVLGSAIVDSPASDQPWTESARYAYVRVRPWVDPPPAVMFGFISGAPAVRPSRVDVVAERSASAMSSINLTGSIGLAGVRDLVIRRSISLNVSVLEAEAVRDGANQIAYRYRIVVNSSVPRGSLAASLTLFYSLGSSYVNSTCPSPLCEANLIEYRGYSRGVDTAVYDVTFTVPAWASHALIVNVFGTKAAVSAARPRLYVLSAGTNAYYLINEGDGTAAFVVPWRQDGPLITGISPDDAKFAGLFHVTDGRDRWTVLLVPPGSVVRVVTASAVDDWRQYLVPWQAEMLTYTDSPCPDPRYVRVYFPGNVTLRRYYVLLPYQPSTVPNGHAFLGGRWASLAVYRDPANMLWLKLSTSQQLTNKAVLVALCGTGTNSPPSSFFDWYSPTPSGGALEFASPPSLSTYPDGYTVAVWHSGPMSVALQNGTDYPPWNCYEGRRIVGIQYTGSDPAFLWHFNGFCFDMHIWERVGSGTPQMYALSISPQPVLYQISTGTDVGSWWLRSYPNVAPALGGRPLQSFTHVYGSAGFSAALIPFTWPRPYIFLDFSENPVGPYSTT